MVAALIVSITCTTVRDYIAIRFESNNTSCLFGA